MVLDGKFEKTEDISRSMAHEPDRLKFLDSFTDPEITKRLVNYRKALFVREPLERLLSAYRNKIEYDFNGKFHRLYGKRIIQKYRRSNVTSQTSKKDRATFTEFIKYLVDLKEDARMDVHWQKFHKLCYPCDIRYDFIGKYESLTGDAAEFLSMIGARDTVRFPGIGKAPRGRETQSLMERYFSQITGEQLNKLWHIYADDYELFNYSRPTYLEAVTKP